MADDELIEGVGDDPTDIEPTDEDIDLSEEVIEDADEDTPEADPDPPKLYAGKYKTPEAMEEAYYASQAEMNRLRAQVQKAPEPEPEPEPLADPNAERADRCKPLAQKEYGKIVNQRAALLRAEYKADGYTAEEIPALVREALASEDKTLQDAAWDAAYSIDDYVQQAVGGVKSQLDAVQVPQVISAAVRAVAAETPFVGVDVAEVEREMMQAPIDTFSRMSPAQLRENVKAAGYYLAGKKLAEGQAAAPRPKPDPQGPRNVGGGPVKGGGRVYADQRSEDAYRELMSSGGFTVEEAKAEIADLAANGWR